MTQLETDYLTATQVARWLQVSEKSVYRWAVHDPSMPALRIGGVVRFPRERLERWVRSREQGARGVRRAGQLAPSVTPGPITSAISAARSSAASAIPRISGSGAARLTAVEERG